MLGPENDKQKVIKTKIPHRRNIRKSNIKIIERDKIDNSDTQIHDLSVTMYTHTHTCT
jgi:hypothetical protein